MWSPINLLKHSHKIYDLTKRDVSDLDLSNINGKLAENHGRAHFSSDLDPLIPWLQKGVLKQEFLGIQENTFFGAKNLENI